MKFILISFFLSRFADHFSVHKEREERIKQLKEKQNEGENCKNKLG